MQNAVSCPLVLLFVFLGYGEGKKGYRCFDPITHKLYMSHHVVFLEHIPFFFIPSTTHYLTRPDIIRIDPFSEDSDNISSQVPSTSDTLSHVRPICTHHPVGTDTLLFSTPEAPFSSTAPQASSEIVNPSLRQSIRIRKSTKLPDFAYSCYSSSFTSFLASIHWLSEPSSIKRQFMILFGSKLWMRNFLLCIRQILGTWFLNLLVRVLLVVVGCIRLRLTLMGLLSDTKLGWLQKDTLNSMVWIMRRHLSLLQK